jgi:Mg-chelatase subunit ChlD
MADGATNWQVNSEYSIGGSTSVHVEKRSALIYLVLDASNSLNPTQIGTIRNAAIDFINLLYDRLNQ